MKDYIKKHYKNKLCNKKNNIKSQLNKIIINNKQKCKILQIILNYLKILNKIMKLNNLCNLISVILQQNQINYVNKEWNCFYKNYIRKQIGKLIL